MDASMHGTALIDQVVERVRRDGWDTTDAPDLDTPVPLPPDVLTSLALPDGRPLPPSLRRWLAFDAGWLAELGWYADPARPDLRGGSLSAVVAGMFGFGSAERAWTESFAAFETLLPGPCLPLFGGRDSRRFLYLGGEPDSHGEYPVLVADMDDIPYVGVEYPGLDVYLAAAAGLDFGLDAWDGPAEHSAYAGRMQEHAELTGLGADGLEIHELYGAEGAEDL
ncbi:hypothetical protein [Kitasatospora paranensis]|uniref:Knr4/Smi1-like domain-containing protein n=1 Tax=Kitasatospora paranensis TaxID=258053 RepID=A0ABW2G3L9_9ACTN